jgi:hypothetical protein
MKFRHLVSRTTSLWIVIAVISGCAGATSEPDTMGDFSIYLVKQGVSAQQMMKMDLSQLELDRSPILSGADIVTYTWETHEIELTEPARERVARPG